MHQIKVPLKKMLDKMKQPLEMLIKLKLMFTSYAELFNGKLCRVFGFLKKRSQLKLSRITFMQCYAEDISQFITVSA